MPLLFQLPLGTNRATESRGKEKDVSHGSSHNLISSASLLLYPLSENTSAIWRHFPYISAFCRLQKNSFIFLLIKIEVLHFNYTKSLFSLFNLLQNQDRSHVNPVAFFCSNGDANCSPNSSCSTQWNPGTGVPCIHASRAALYSLQFTFLHHCWYSLTDFRKCPCKQAMD